MKVLSVALFLLFAGAKPVLALPDDNLGVWGDVFDLEVIPIHAMLLPDNKVLMYGTDDRGKQGGDIYYEVWDVSGGQHELAGNHDLLEHKTDVDIFCTTSSLDVSTGNYVLIGGDNGDNRGVTDVLEFNTKTHEIRKHPLGKMKYPRWYATSVGLPNGDVFVVGGRSESRKGSDICELWSPKEGFRELKNTEIPAIERNKGGSWWYPLAYVNSSGDILVIIGNGLNTDVYLIGVDGDGSLQKVGEKPFENDELSPAIMFDVDQVAMIANNGDLWVMDITDSSKPKFDKKNDVGDGRTNAAMNVLPDGRVIITGGCKTTKDAGNTEEDANKRVQIWNPRQNTIYSGPSEKIARLYHSSALILPDGTVYSGGGGAPGPLKNLNGNIYTPGYLFDPDTGNEAERPGILKWPQNIEAGVFFEITVDDSNNVDMVTMTKPGAMTHAKNCDHRWLDLDFDILDAATIKVYTLDRNIMIPGLWMVNIVSDDGVPSEGRLLGVNMVALDHFYVPDDIDLTTQTAIPPPPPPPLEQTAPASTPVRGVSFGFATASPVGQSVPDVEPDFEPAPPPENPSPTTAPVAQTVPEDEPATAPETRGVSFGFATSPVGQSVPDVEPAPPPENALPTAAPVAQTVPDDEPETLLPLKYVRNNGGAAYALGQCEGECDSDEECAPGLYCFDDQESSTVPGCTGVRSQGGNGYDDYCTAYYE